MGDRANVVLRSKSAANCKTLGEAVKGALVLYSHWGGCDLGPDLAKALLAARGRWQDDAYGARIVVSQIIGKQWQEETGFGLLVGELGDNEHPVFVVDFEDQVVRLYGDAGQYYGPSEALEQVQTAEWIFTHFANLSERDAKKAHRGIDREENNG